MILISVVPNRNTKGVEMVKPVFEENLKAFGLTGQESTIYRELLKKGSMTGYEVSKETGISRSNAYSSLSGLVEKGAAYLVEGEATRYTPVDISEFTGNALKRMQEIAKRLVADAPKPEEKTEGYITISGTAHIKDKVRNMLMACEHRVYVMAESTVLEEFRGELERLALEEKKVVILSDKTDFPGTIVYETDPQEGQLRLITDSSFVLTGSLANKETDTCLYSAQTNLVSVMKEALKNRITLIDMKKEKNK